MPHLTLLICEAPTDMTKLYCNVMGSIHRTRKSTLLLSLARQSKNDYDDSEETQKMTKNTVTDNLEPSRATPKMETWLLNQLENVIAITIHHYNIMNNIVART